MSDRWIERLKDWGIKELWDREIGIKRMEGLEVEGLKDLGIWEF